MVRLQNILTPSAEREAAANRVDHCLPVLRGIRDILWSESPPPSGRSVRKQLFAYLAAECRRAPQRGRGAYRRRFVEHAQKVTRSYAKGLFHCYDDPRIPHTSNALESVNGSGKMNLRRCAGRASTANGPGSSSGRAHMYAVALHRTMPTEELENILCEYSVQDYLKSKEILRDARHPAAQRRSFLRHPIESLKRIVASWWDKDT